MTKYDWKENLMDFEKQMVKKIKANMDEKGLSWRKMSNEQLLPLIQKYVEHRDFVSVANVSFMLWENMQPKSGLGYVPPLFKE